MDDPGKYDPFCGTFDLLDVDKEFVHEGGPRVRYMNVNTTTGVNSILVRNGDSRTDEFVNILKEGYQKEKFPKFTVKDVN